MLKYANPFKPEPELQICGHLPNKAKDLNPNPNIWTCRKPKQTWTWTLGKLANPTLDLHCLASLNKLLELQTFSAVFHSLSILRPCKAQDFNSIQKSFQWLYFWCMHLMFGHWMSMLMEVRKNWRLNQGMQKVMLIVFEKQIWWPFFTFLF